ncbi:MAG: serine/threonine protein kinase [Polyangiaceae bacterium]|nr:serine/threonine protein kinase [Polyangiaceae bacterium]
MPARQDSALAYGDFPVAEAPPPPSQQARRHSERLAGYSIKPGATLGKRIGGRYIVEGLLGEGGTARVYLARDTMAEEESMVVVKQLRQEVANNSTLKNQFLMEARALLKLNHQNIVKILSIENPREGTPFLVLEALKGETLGDYLKRHGMMDTELALKLVRDAAHALESAHASGVVHRDLKPDNLFLLGPIDAPEALKVIDFGMAELDAQRLPDQNTSILGTAQYMAPEQILVEGMDARTDIYALGVVLFRAITGELPFEAKKQNDIFRHQLYSPIPPASWLVDTLPWQVDKLIHKATRKSPAGRLSTMQSFARAIDHSLGDAPESRSEQRINAEAEEWNEDPDLGSEDVYEPVTPQGRRAYELLAHGFGNYARPHSPLPPTYQRQGD